MPSPVSVEHSEAHGFVVGLFVTYGAATPGVRVNDNATVRLDLDNEVQPDALLRLEAALGGNCKISADHYLEGSPELVAEVAYSSAAYDLHDKLKIYRRARVQEYIVWQIHENRLDWFHLTEKAEYVLLEADEGGIIRSRVFPGLNLKVRALLDGDLAEVLAVLQQALGSGEHLAFVEKLQTR